MESLDLNIDNYELKDILALFNLPTLFGEQDLKRAKMMVLKTHPDKSNLSKDYFLFFTKAYRIVHQIYSIRNPSIKEHYTERIRRNAGAVSSATTLPSMGCVAKDTQPYIPIDANMAAAAGAKVVDYNRVMRKEGYQADNTDEYAMKTHLLMKQRLDEMMYGVGGGGGGTSHQNQPDSKINKLREFNTWFNQKFEQYKLKDEEQESGYDEWFRGEGKSDETETNTDDINDAGTWQDKVAMLNKQKQELRNKYALVEKHDWEHAGGTGGSGYDLTRERPQEYSSGIFGNLRYEDLKKAHTESVIPVTEEDYHAAKKFRNVNDLQAFRDVNRRSFQVNEQEQQQSYLRTKTQQEEEDTRRAFILAKQDEISRDIHTKLYSDMFLLKR
jgi:hypothetical protein